MSDRPNMVKFYETFARIISDREGVDVRVTVRMRDDVPRVFHQVDNVRCRRVHRNGRKVV